MMLVRPAEEFAATFLAKFRKLEDAIHALVITHDDFVNYLATARNNAPNVGSRVIDSVWIAEQLTEAMEDVGNVLSCLSDWRRREGME